MVELDMSLSDAFNRRTVAEPKNTPKDISAPEIEPSMLAPQSSFEDDLINAIEAIPEESIIDAAKRMNLENPEQFQQVQQNGRVAIMIGDRIPSEKASGVYGQIMIASMIAEGKPASEIAANDFSRLLEIENHDMSIDPEGIDIDATSNRLFAAANMAIDQGASIERLANMLDNEFITRMRQQAAGSDLETIEKLTKMENVVKQLQSDLRASDIPQEQEEQTATQNTQPKPEAFSNITELSDVAGMYGLSINVTSEINGITEITFTSGDSVTDPSDAMPHQGAKALLRSLNSELIGEFKVATYDDYLESSTVLIRDGDDVNLETFDSELAKASNQNLNDCALEDGATKVAAIATEQHQAPHM